MAIVLSQQDLILVFDQPEDELDHAYITGGVVESLVSIKGRRQVIAATHNANIPVLGDAEYIVRLETVQGKARRQVGVDGGFDDPDVLRAVQILEGGAEAFELRRERYG